MAEKGKATSMSETRLQHRIQPRDHHTGNSNKPWSSPLVQISSAGSGLSLYTGMSSEAALRVGHPRFYKTNGQRQRKIRIEYEVLTITNAVPVLAFSLFSTIQGSLSAPFMKAGSDFSCGMPFCLKKRKSAETPRQQANSTNKKRTH